MKITKIAHLISQVIFHSKCWHGIFTIYSLLIVLVLSERQFVDGCLEVDQVKIYNLDRKGLSEIIDHGILE